MNRILLGMLLFVPAMFVLANAAIFIGGGVMALRGFYRQLGERRKSK